MCIPCDELLTTEHIYLLVLISLKKNEKKGNTILELDH